MNIQYPGYFLSFEGIDGAGKSTHIEAFGELLKQQHPNREVVMTREPGVHLWVSNSENSCSMRQ